MTMIVGAALLMVGELAAQAGPRCWEGRVTGYVRSEYGPFTFDGTPIMTSERIAAAAWNVPIDTMIEVEGLGMYRIADRGMLGNDGWIDVAVWTRAEAYAATGVRRVCIVRPEAEIPKKASTGPLFWPWP